MAREIKEMEYYKDKLLKLIPTEIVGAYLVLQGLIPQSRAKIWLPIVSICLCIITFLYLKFLQKVNRISQLIISTGSFGVWLLAIGGPFKYFGWYEPFIGSIVLVLWSLIIPFSIKTKPQQNN